jgi:membrane associated rhomboid family serine protease
MSESTTFHFSFFPFFLFTEDQVVECTRVQETVPRYLDIEDMTILEFSEIYIDVENEASNPFEIESLREHNLILMSNSNNFFTIIWTAIILGSYIVGALVSEDYNDLLYCDFITSYPECKDQRNQIWRLLTVILVHMGVSHISFNLIAFILWSSLIEFYQDYRRLCIIFILGVCESSLGFYYTDPYASATGCSGGVWVIVGANVSNCLINIDVYSYAYSFIILTCSLITITWEAIAYNEKNQIAYISHWIGGVSGFLGGMWALRRFSSKHKNPYIVIRCISVIAYVSIWMWLVYNFAWNYPPLKSYSNILKEVPSPTCCYLQFKYIEDGNYLNNFQCREI